MIRGPQKVEFSELQNQLTKLHHCKQGCDLLQFTSMITDRTVGQKSFDQSTKTIVKLKKQNSHQKTHS